MILRLQLLHFPSGAVQVMQPLPYLLLNQRSFLLPGKRRTNGTVGTAERVRRVKKTMGRAGRRRRRGNRTWASVPGAGGRRKEATVLRPAPATLGCLTEGTPASTSKTSNWKTECKRHECKSKTSIEARNVADCCPKLAPLALASLNMHHVFLLPTCYTESLHYHVA